MEGWGRWWEQWGKAWPSKATGQRVRVLGVGCHRWGKGAEQVEALEDLPRGPKEAWEQEYRTNSGIRFRGCVVVWGSGPGVLGGSRSWWVTCPLPRWRSLTPCPAFPWVPAPSPGKALESQPGLQCRFPRPICSCGEARTATGLPAGAEGAKPRWGLLTGSKEGRDTGFLLTRDWAPGGAGV